ncbi:hypothetical protein ZIOFF_011922 [Zingiber officinale]|uniref:Uncharacterized protein n=1 Tax=Zingiber officinale TaxID=94328 RepID=A0A8J5HNQ3_ZINOF|nr:hypothetical protein ZIOFF_011922 [Zingiber officinale]
MNSFFHLYCVDLELKSGDISFVGGYSLSAGTSRLENEKVQKEAEVQKLIEENAGLRALVDKKEAQLLAMNEQCKFIALRSPGI